MSWIFVGVSVASTAVSVYGQIRQGENAASLSNLQADWSRQNAQWARDDADQARKDAERARGDADRTRAEGYAAEDATRREGRASQGRLNASVAQSGVDAGSGSALRVATQSATYAELDALNVRYAGLMKGYSVDLQAQGLDRDAVRFDREATGHLRSAAVGQYQARQQREGGYYGAASSILSSAANYYGKKK